MLSVTESVPMAQAWSFTTPLPPPREAGAIIPVFRMDSETGHTPRRTRIQT